MEGSRLWQLCSTATLFSDFAVGGYPTCHSTRSNFASPASSYHTKSSAGGTSLVRREAKRKGVNQDIIVMDLLTFSWEAMN